MRKGVAVTVQRATAGGGARRVWRAALYLPYALTACAGGSSDVAVAMAELNPPLEVAAALASGPLTEPAGEVELFRPSSLAVLGDTIVIADTGNDRVVAVDTGLHVVWVSGREGAGPGEFRVPLTVRTSPDAVVVLEMENGRYTELDRSGAYRRTIPSGGAATSFGLASDGAILAPARSPTDWVMRRDGESARPLAPRTDTLRGEEASKARFGSRSPRVAVTAGDTMHVFDDVGGSLLKFAPDGGLVMERSLPRALLDSMRANAVGLVEAFAKQGIAVTASPLSRGLTVTRDGRLFLLFSSGVTTGLLIDPATYEARRIVVPDWTSRWAPLRSATTAVVSGDRIFALTAAEILVWRIEEGRDP